MRQPKAPHPAIYALAGLLAVLSPFSRGEEKAILSGLFYCRAEITVREPWLRPKFWAR